VCRTILVNDIESQRQDATVDSVADGVVLDLGEQVRTKYLPGIAVQVVSLVTDEEAIAGQPDAVQQKTGQTPVSSSRLVV